MYPSVVILRLARVRKDNMRGRGYVGGEVYCGGGGGGNDSDTPWASSSKARGPGIETIWPSAKWFTWFLSCSSCLWAPLIGRGANTPTTQTTTTNSNNNTSTHHHHHHHHHHLDQHNNNNKQQQQQTVTTTRQPTTNHHHHHHHHHPTMVSSRAPIRPALPHQPSLYLEPKWLRWQPLIILRPPSRCSPGHRRCNAARPTTTTATLPPPPPATPFMFVLCVGVSHWLGLCPFPCRPPPCPSPPDGALPRVWASLIGWSFPLPCRPPPSSRHWEPLIGTARHPITACGSHLLKATRDTWHSHMHLSP